MADSPQSKRRTLPPGMGGKQAGAGRKALPPEQRKQTKQLTLRLPPDLYDYLKSLPPGSAERILRQYHTDSLIV